MAQQRDLEARRRLKVKTAANTVELAALTARVAVLEDDVATLTADITAILQHLSLVGVPNLESTVTLNPPTVA